MAVALGRGHEPFTTFTRTVGALRRFLPATLRLSAFLLLGGGGYSTTVTWTAASPEPLPPRSPEPVEVFAGTVPARSHVGLGVIEVQEVSGAYEPQSRDPLRELRA